MVELVISENKLKENFKRKKKLEDLNKFPYEHFVLIITTDDGTNIENEYILKDDVVTLKPPGMDLGIRFNIKNPLDAEAFQGNKTLEVSKELVLKTFEEIMYHINTLETLYPLLTEKKIVVLKEKIVREKVGSKSKKKKIKYVNKTRYVIEYKSDEKREYTKCNEKFTVSGHYRRYKSGKVIWVKPFDKNKDAKVENNRRKI